MCFQWSVIRVYVIYNYRRKNRRRTSLSMSTFYCVETLLQLGERVNYYKCCERGWWLVVVVVIGTILANADKTKEIIYQSDWRFRDDIDDNMYLGIGTWNVLLYSCILYVLCIGIVGESPRRKPSRTLLRKIFCVAVSDRFELFIRRKWTKSIGKYRVDVYTLIIKLHVYNIIYCTVIVTSAPLTTRLSLFYFSG